MGTSVPPGMLWSEDQFSPVRSPAPPPSGPISFHLLMKNDRMLTALSPEALPSALAMMGHPLRGLEMDKVTPS